MNIILFGPPGAGKGTQADNIVKNFSLHKVSTGDLLRNEITNNTKLGKKIKSIVDNGILVTDDIINNFIERILSNKDFYNRLIFDGYPRNLNQTKNLDFITKKYKQKISCVLSLDVNKESVVKRVLGRQSCTKCGSIFNKYYNPATSKNHFCEPKFLIKRFDDNEKTIVKRFETYIEKTLPILNYYKEQNLLYKINGEAKIDQIYQQIQGIIVSLET